jgi:hypothetical protein
MTVGAVTAALVLDGVRAMTAAERKELRDMLDVGQPSAVAADGWMDAHTAADYLGLSVNSLHKLTAARAIPLEQDGPGCKLWFARSDLDRWRRGGETECFQRASTCP